MASDLEDSMTARHIFISYSRKDSVIAGTVYDRLRAAGLAVWLDQRSIRAGLSYAEEIVRAIEHAGAMVLLLSADANASKEIHREVQLASTGDVPIIPIRLAEVAYHPALKYHLSATQWVDGTVDVERAIADLLDTLGRLDLAPVDSPALRQPPNRQDSIAQTPMTGGRIRRAPARAAMDEPTSSPQTLETLRAAIHRLSIAGDLLSPEELRLAYATFQQRFGPDMLATLRGEDLLHTMFDGSHRASLVRWLDHGDPDDPRLHKGRFGLIGGGAQYARFGLFKSQSGVWKAGKSSQGSRDVTPSEAADVVSRIRDQLIHGCEVLRRVPADGDDAAYAVLQSSLDRQAADVVTRAWAHKYFHMVHPEVLDDYHTPDLQRTHLLRLGQVPPVGTGRYLAGGRFVRLCRDLDVPMNHLSAALNNT